MHKELQFFSLFKMKMGRQKTCSDCLKAVNIKLYLKNGINPTGRYLDDLDFFMKFHEIRYK